jgi:cell shape-determining protein MreD
MKGLGGVLVSIALLWLAGVAQMALAPRMEIGHGIPNFLLVALACLSVYGNRRSATMVGFGAGLIEGVLAGANLTLYVASRTVAGFLVGWFNALDVEVNAILCVVTAIVVTLFAQFLLLFLGAHHGPLPPFLEGTLVTAVYDGVIALPVYALLNRLLSVPSTRAD